ILSYCSKGPPAQRATDAQRAADGSARRLTIPRQSTRTRQCERGEASARVNRLPAAVNRRPRPAAAATWQPIKRERLAHGTDRRAFARIGPQRLLMTRHLL